MIFNFYVVKKITFQKLFAIHHKSARDLPVSGTDAVGQRCTSRAQRAMMCAAVPCTRARDGTARHVAVEGRAASAIRGEGEHTLSERDR
jgi:hypothetical protein